MAQVGYQSETRRPANHVVQCVECRLDIEPRFGAFGSEDGELPLPQ